MQALYRLTGDEIHDHIRFLKSVSQLVEPAMGIPVVLSDPADNPVIYTAVAAGADVLCVKDNTVHLVRAHTCKHSCHPGNFGAALAVPISIRVRDCSEPR